MRVRARRDQPERNAFTLLELVVVIGLVLIMVALLLPAVVAARGSANRVRCGNNLHQLGVAFHAYGAVWGGLPPATAFEGDKRRGGLRSYLSVFARILPMLGEDEVHRKVTESETMFSDKDVIANTTVSYIRLATFLCPSDPRSAAGRVAPTSYRANIGPSFDGPSFDSGGLAMFYATPYNQFTDGMSSTILLSEKPIGTGSVGGGFTPFRDFADLRASNAFYDADHWIAICSNINDNFLFRSYSGWTWLLADPEYTLFTTALPPNSEVPDCGSIAASSGLFTARSYHGQGANSLMVDGSVRWFPKTMDRVAWRALGTRNGGELVP